jgi:uncharacterized protein YbaR (Trm112 family)
MSEGFVPHLNYAVCPNCKNKVDIPQDREMFRMRSKKGELLCPFCNATIEYIEPGKLTGSPYSIE